MKTKNNFIALSVPVFGAKELANIKECLDTGWVSGAGRFAAGFEADLKKYLKVKHAALCVTGSLALKCALQACGVSKGHEVITPTLTYIATVNSLLEAGAMPVFIDCDNYANLNADAFEEFCKTRCALTKQGLKNKETGRIIKAVVVVHVFGNVCQMDKILKTAKKYKLKVVEDAAESLGSSFVYPNKKMRHSGTMGDAGIFSFNANKIISCGSGGLIVCNNNALGKKIAYLTTQAKNNSFYKKMGGIGNNYKMTNIQAAIGVEQLKELNKRIKLKKQNYLLYKKLLKNVKGVELLDIAPYSKSNYWYYSLIINEKEYGLTRDALLGKFAQNNIHASKLWNLNHKQVPFTKCTAYKINNALHFEKNLINIPCTHNLTKSEITVVVNLIKSFAKK